MKRITTKLVRGHEVASGGNRDPRFPEGTIRMQIPHFAERGLDLSDWFPATLNLSLSPRGFELREANFTFREVDWHPTEPAEDFSFFACEVRSPETDDWFAGWGYYPHPETKPEHFQPDDLLEVMVERKLPGLAYGDPVELRADPHRIVWTEPEETQQG